MKSSSHFMISFSNTGAGRQHLLDTRGRGKGGGEMGQNTIQRAGRYNIASQSIFSRTAVLDCD